MGEHQHNGRDGFTLIELSIVLVIIGLIVGGILTGQSLIAAAGARAQITQIEKFNQAVNTFHGKYGYLPGDIPNPLVTQFGFTTRLGDSGHGDGNGIIQGNCHGCAAPANGSDFDGETLYFWTDLSTANLLNGYLNSLVTTSGGTCPAGDAISMCLPAASIGNGNYVYVYSGGLNSGFNGDGNNYYGLSAVTSLVVSGEYMSSTADMTVKQAYDIDQKIDDGLPQSGNVTALYINICACASSSQWAGSSVATGTPPFTTATSGSSTTCFDNSVTANGAPGVSGAAQHYSVEIANGSNVNCALSFRFQ